MKHRLPTMGWTAETVEAGWLMSYGPDILSLYRRAAYYVDKVLKGAKPAELPVEQPTKFEVAPNMRTANALGVTIPPSYGCKRIESLNDAALPNIALQRSGARDARPGR